MRRYVLVSLVAVAGLLAMRPGQVWAGEGQRKTVFSWMPGEAKVKMAVGRAEFRTAPEAQLIDAPPGKAVQPGDDGRIGEAELKLGTIPERGTISFWIKLSRTIRHCGPGEKVTGPLIQCEDLTKETGRV